MDKNGAHFHELGLVETKVLRDSGSCAWLQSALSGAHLGPIY